MMGEHEVVTPTIQELCKPVETNLKCIYKECGRTFLHRPALNMHLTQTHKLKGYGEYKKHGPRRVYLCPISSCQRSSVDRSFPTLRQLRQHYECMHAKKTLPCSLCEKKFATSALLKAHLENCGKTFVCNVCHIPFATKEGVAKHQRSQHTAAYCYAKILIKQQNNSTLASSQDRSGGDDNNSKVMNLPSNIISSEVANAPICADFDILTTRDERQSFTENDISQSHVNYIPTNQSVGDNCSNLTIQSDVSTCESPNIIVSPDHNYSRNPLPVSSIHVTSQPSDVIINMSQSAKTSNNTSQFAGSGCNTSQSASSIHNTSQSVHTVKRKYVRILPNVGVRVDCTTQTHPGTADNTKVLHSSRESSATQTDMLDSAVKSSGLLLQSRRHVMTCTTDIPNSQIFEASNSQQHVSKSPSSHVENAPLSQQLYSNRESSSRAFYCPPIQTSNNVRLVSENARTSDESYVRLRSTAPLDFTTQSVGNHTSHQLHNSLMTTMPIEFGTQTLFMEGEDGHFSNQLQNSLRSTAPVEFGTQTLSMDIDVHNLHQFCNSPRTTTPTEFGTQTPELNSEAENSLCNLYNSFRSSTPAEFGTQTSFMEFESTPTAQNIYFNNSLTEFGTQTSFVESERTRNLYCNSLSSITPSEFSAQTSGLENASAHNVPNTDLGTQTIFSALLEEMDGSSTSIELQCDLGEAPLQLPDTASSCSIQDMMSFGTQTIYAFSELDSIPSVMSSFGTQTSVAQTLTVKDLEIPERSMHIRPAPRQSTSDFAMQFPYELMNFGTQTPLPAHAEFIDSQAFCFEEDDLLNSETGERLCATLSQSSTQTDLDFLFNNIETQTESWQF